MKVRQYSIETSWSLISRALDMPGLFRRIIVLCYVFFALTDDNNNNNNNPHCGPNETHM